MQSGMGEPLGAQEMPRCGSELKAGNGVVRKCCYFGINIQVLSQDHVQLSGSSILSEQEMGLLGSSLGFDNRHHRHEVCQDHFGECMDLKVPKPEQNTFHPEGHT